MTTIDFRKTYPSFVLENVDTLEAERMYRNLTRKALSTQCEVPLVAIRKAEEYGIMPSQANYNKLAAVFGWEAWQ